MAGLQRRAAPSLGQYCLRTERSLRDAVELLQTDPKGRCCVVNHRYFRLRQRSVRGRQSNRGLEHRDAVTLGEPDGETGQRLFGRRVGKRAHVALEVRSRVRPEKSCTECNGDLALVMRDVVAGPGHDHHGVAKRRDYPSLNICVLRQAVAHRGFPHGYARIAFDPITDAVEWEDRHKKEGEPASGGLALVGPVDSARRAVEAASPLLPGYRPPAPDDDQEWHLVPSWRASVVTLRWLITLRTN